MIPIHFSGKSQIFSLWMPRILGVIFASTIQADSSRPIQNVFPLKTELLASSFDNPITSTIQMYLPIVSVPPPVPRPMGTVNLLTGPVQCDDQDCYDVAVKCIELTLSITNTLKVGEPISLTLKGTILFVTDWNVTWYFT